MTTLIGIKTNAGLEGIVLAADRQRGVYDGKELVSKRPEGKLQVGDYWVMGHAGYDDDRKAFNEFYGVLKGHKTFGSNDKKAEVKINRALRRKIFMEVIWLNNAFSAKNVAQEEMPSFIFAVNRLALGLWLVDAYGNLKEPDSDNEFDYVCLGSGAEIAQEYIKNLVAEEKIDKDNIRIRTAFNLARDVIKYAEKIESATGLGYDLYVLTENKISEHGREIRKEMEEAEDKKSDLICVHYEKLEQEENKEDKKTNE